jgi:serine protease AprX
MITNRNSTSTFTPSLWRHIFCSLFLIAALVAAVGAIASSGQPAEAATKASAIRPPEGGTPNLPAQKIAPWVREHTAKGQEAEFFVVLADQADLGQAATFQTKAEKGRYVYNTLLNKSQTTQGPILQWLRARGLESRSFYIVNAILVKGTREVADALATRPDVARVEGNPLIHNNLPQPEPATEGPRDLQRPGTVEPGINYTHAPLVWAEGFTGQTIVLASADTGVRWTHNALKPHYRGWDGMNADHDYNWHDSIHNSVGNPCGNDSPFPCDDLGHGTHTTGTMVGDDGMGNQIGMAPGAKWIGCRNMDANTGSPARYIECMQWFLAPTRIGGGDPDPTKAPDITNNSWECPPSEGCSANTLQAAVDAQAAAGIMMVSAAQNSGPNCSTVQNPPGIYASTYTAGALTTGTDTIASFSSRGPVVADGSNRIKPDITAPGTGTRSSYNTSDSAYANLSGTSMATPHTSGAMALLWSAVPSLRHQITISREALNNAAVHINSTLCGDAGPPNNVYGWGRVDIKAAVDSELLTITSAVSRKTHGAAGTFDIAMPLTGPSGVECRTNGGTNDYTLVVTFSTNVTVTGSPQAQVTSGTGCVGTAGACSGNVSVNGAVVTVPLTNIANAQVINVRINGVNSAAAAPASDFTIPMSVLSSDTNANGTVNAADVAQSKARLGQTVDATNFRSDVNANGTLNEGDVSLVKSNLGTGLP